MNAPSPSLRRFAVVAMAGFVTAACTCAAAWAAPPTEMAALGDSLTRGYGSSGTLADYPDGSWSTGADSIVNSHYSRVARLTTDILGDANNDAASGSKISAVPGQATTAINQGAEYATILSGTNDVCKAGTVAQMTSVASYGASLNQALTTLSNGLPAGGTILVASIPDWLKLRTAFKDDPSATAAWAQVNACPLIFDPGTSSADRTAAGQRIQDYNARAKTECASFPKCRYDGGAVFDLTFTAADLAPDFFHFSKNGQAKLAAATWPSVPYAQLATFYDSLSKDGSCGGCVARYDAPTLTAKVAGAANAQDSAWGVRDFGGASGTAARVFVRTVVSLAPGQTLTGQLTILEVLAPNGSTIYELFLTPGREIRLKSPAGGLRSTALTLSTGITVPNNGGVRQIEVSALRNSSVIVRVDGVDRASNSSLSGATSGNQRYLSVGITKYAGTSTSPAEVQHTHVAVSTTDWLGNPGGGGGGGDTTAPAAPTSLSAAANGPTQVDLDWANNGEPDLAGYNVYRSTSAGGTYAKVNSSLVNASQFSDTNAPSNATVHYKVTAVDTSGNESAYSSVASATTPPGSQVGPYEAFTIDEGCGVCSLVWSDPELQATIGGAGDDVDTAYATDEVGGAGGLAGRTFTRTVFRLANGQTLDAQLYVFALHDVNGRTIFQLFLNQSRILRLTSPAGGLHSTSLNQSTGVTVPNNGTPVVVEVSALANNSVAVRVDGVQKFELTGLSGATSGNVKNLHAGILHYAGTSTGSVTVGHASVGISTAGWLGAP